MNGAFFWNCWALFHRLKIPFLIIFFSVNFGFLRRYGYQGDIWSLLSTFTMQNFALHIFNNYFDKLEDEVSGQRSILSAQPVLLGIGILATLISAGMAYYLGLSLHCYFILFALMIVYSIPFSRKWRLKNLLFFKNIAGSLFWWYIPFALITSSHTAANFWRVFLDNAITLAIFMPFEPLWDIKDAEGDKASGIRTIPNQYGLRATKLLVISSFLLLAVVRINNPPYIVSFLIPLIILTAIFTEKNKLIVSQFLMFFVAAHTFTAGVLWPILILPLMKPGG